MTQNNHYEHKLVNIGEEADNLIHNLRERNKVLQAIVDSKKDVPENFEQEKKVYQFRVDTIEKHNKKLRDDLAKAFELSLQDTELRKEVDSVRKANLHLEKMNSLYRQENLDLKQQWVDNSKNLYRDRLTYLEKILGQCRYVFSDIPNNDFGREFVNRMKYYLNKKKFTLRKRGQYLDDKTKETEGWKPYSDGQPLSKSKCIRVYIDNKGSIDTTEGFNLQEIDLILDGLYGQEDKCQEKATLEQTLTLQKYFESMKIHLEECKLNMVETNEG